MDIPDNILLDVTAPVALTDLGFGNGSLFEQLQHNFSDHVWNRSNAFPLHQQDPGASMTIFPNRTAQLNFNGGNSNISYSMPLLAMLLQPNATRVPISCTYPLSGQYDVLTRMLFYVVLIAAILFRRRGWIAAAALGTVMTYSAAAAVHFFILLTQFRWKQAESGSFGWNSQSSVNYGDIDYYGIYPIISAAGIMLPPILTWSSTFRNHEARALLIYWSLFILAALLPVIVLDIRTWDLNEIPSFAYCVSIEPKCSWWNLDHHFTQDLYDQCKCVDFCGVVGPQAPLRRSAVMVPDLGREIASEVKLTVNLNLLQRSVWIIALIHGFVALLHSGTSPEHTLHKLFQTLSSPREMNREASLGEGGVDKAELSQASYRSASGRFWLACRRAFARIVATGFYFIAILGSFGYPVMFVINAVLCELELARSPTSEHSDAVGAWSPWLGLGLLITGSLIIRYHHSFVSTLKAFLFSIQTNKHRRPSQNTSFFQTARNFLSGCSDRLVHLRSVVSAQCKSFENHAKFFGRWWTNPEKAFHDYKLQEERNETLLREIARLEHEIKKRQMMLDQKNESSQADCPCDHCSRERYQSTPRPKVGSRHESGEHLLGPFEWERSMEIEMASVHTPP